MYIVQDYSLAVIFCAHDPQQSIVTTQNMTAKE